jgi:uncharacterized protein (TIGR03643 family)
MEINDQFFCYYSGLLSPIAYMDAVKIKAPTFNDTDVDRIIEMAWEDKTTFDAIKLQFGLNEAAVKALMKKELKFNSYKLWRKRVERCTTKHASKRINGINRFKSDLQRTISINKISKR